MNIKKLDYLHLRSSKSREFLKKFCFQFVEDDNTLWDKKAAKKQLLFQGSSLDIPTMENSGMEILNRNHYDDQDSEVNKQRKIKK